MLVFRFGPISPSGTDFGPNNVPDLLNLCRMFRFAVVQSGFLGVRLAFLRRVYFAADLQKLTRMSKQQTDMRNRQFAFRLLTDERLLKEISDFQPFRFNQKYVSSTLKEKGSGRREETAVANRLNYATERRRT